MSDSSKQGSLWARILGAREANDSPPSPPPPNDDEAISFDAADDDAGATLKLSGVAPPIPEFARNPLEKELKADPLVDGSWSPRPAAGLPLATPVPPTEGELPIALPVASTPLPPCPSCGSPRRDGAVYCGDCGYHFPGNDVLLVATLVDLPAVDPALSDTPPSRIRGRYLVGATIGEKLGVVRSHGLDADCDPPRPVVIVSARIDDEPVESVSDSSSDEIVPTFDADIAALPSDTVPIAEIQSLAAWPRPGWERAVLQRVEHPALPRVVEWFLDGNAEYLVLESPQGQSLWDAWDDPDETAHTRYGWIVELADAMRAVQVAGARFESLSPDQLVIADGRLRIRDVGDLLPIPMPADAPLRGTLYTAPELLVAPETADPRAALYTIGAILYSLEYLHHGLEEGDFQSRFVPKQISDRFPDVHPLFLRLVNKTFVKDPAGRFPTDEASRTDPTGFEELTQTLALCQRVFDSVRLDVAAWTTTGMVRTGNEDAFAVLHGVDSRQDELRESCLVLLCDGMGGYEAGEVAAALAIAEMKKHLLAQPMFAGLAGKDAPASFDVDQARRTLDAALRHANREVFAAARTPGRGKRGMGCTAEAVYVDSQNLVVGHVGDSRVYHLSNGRLKQITRDQTLVNRLVELGQIRADEAENHPRKNELQQAVGGQPDVNPATYAARLRRGDWVLVCSDGLSNHITNQELETMLTREASNSSEEAARRLLNLVNLRGATDNAAIVVIRAT